MDVRLAAPLLLPTFENEVLYDAIDEKPFDGSVLKKSSMYETLINGFMNDVSRLLL